MSKDNLGDRMKQYENVNRIKMTRRMPLIIRLDGKAFHTFTRGFQKPFDEVLMKTMWQTTQYLCENIMGCKVGYTQSDEITLLLTDYTHITSEAWYEKNLQKIVSVSASMATLAFNTAFVTNVVEWSTGALKSNENDKLSVKYINCFNTALFDSRAYLLPKEEVCNNFIWRQQDATRNAIQMVGQANFSHKSLQKKSCDQIQEMLFQEKGINFNDLPTSQKRGACIVKETYMKNEAERTRWVIDKDIPIFTQDRNYIEKYL